MAGKTRSKPGGRAAGGGKPGGHSGKSAEKRQRPVTAAPAPATRKPIPWGSPAGLAGVVGALLGVATTVHGIMVIQQQVLPVVYWIFVMLLGPLLTVVSWQMLRRSRAGWAFFIGITAPMFLATFFGSARIREETGAPWVGALLPALVFGALCILAALDSAQFEGDEEP